MKCVSIGIVEIANRLSLYKDLQAYLSNVSNCILNLQIYIYLMSQLVSSVL